MDGKQAFPSIAPRPGVRGNGAGEPGRGHRRRIGAATAPPGTASGGWSATCSPPRASCCAPPWSCFRRAWWSRGGGAPERTLVRLAVAVELLHSASLVHDDIIDGEPLRRGQPTLNRRYGDHTAVLVGDLLYARCFALLTALELPRWEQHREILDLFSRTGPVHVPGGDPRAAGPGEPGPGGFRGVPGHPAQQDRGAHVRLLPRRRPSPAALPPRSPPPWPSSGWPSGWPSSCWTTRRTATPWSQEGADLRAAARVAAGARPHAAGRPGRGVGPRRAGSGLRPGPGGGLRLTRYCGRP